MLVVVVAVWLENDRFTSKQSLYVVYTARMGNYPVNFRMASADSVIHDLWETYGIHKGKLVYGCK